MCNGILHSSENEQIIATSNTVETPCKHTEQIPSGLVALPLTRVHCWRHWCHTFLSPASFPQVPASHLPHPQSWSIIRTDLLEPCWCDLPEKAHYLEPLIVMSIAWWTPWLRAGPSDTIYPYIALLGLWETALQVGHFTYVLASASSHSPLCHVDKTPTTQCTPPPRLGQFTPTSCCISDMPIITQSTKEKPDLSLNTIRPRVYNEMYINTFFWALSCGISLERKISFATAH